MTGASPSGDPRGLSHRREVAGRCLLFDGEGFLWQADDWDEEVAQALARESGLHDLDEIQWRVVRFLRDYYHANGRSPLNRQLAQGTDLKLLELERLFPGGIKHGARKIAGLPNPKSCM